MALENMLKENRHKIIRIVLTHLYEIFRIDEASFINITDVIDRNIA